MNKPDRVHPLELKPGSRYSADGRFPMVKWHLDDVGREERIHPVGSIDGLLRLPEGEPFRVIESIGHAGNVHQPWYFVETRFGTGWVNSSALFGTQILVTSPTSP